MKMILAIDNKKIEDELIKRYITKYHIFVVKTKDIILQLVSKDEDVLLVLRDDLPGEVDTLDFLDEIKNISNLTTIMIVKNVDNLTKEKLYSREVFNIIDGKKLRIQDLLFSIDNPKSLSIVKEGKENKENIIFVIGNSGSGKTMISKIIAQNIANDTKKKILVIDMDYINPSLDLYINGVKNYSLVDYIKDVMNSKIKELENYETADDVYQNIKYILNQKGIGIPNDEITLQLFQILKHSYDYIIVDTSSYMIDKMYCIAQAMNSIIIYLIEPNVYMLKSLNKEILSNSIVILNRYRENKEVVKIIKSKIDFPVYEKIHRFNNISKIINGKKNIRLKNLEKILEIKHYTKFQKLVKKIVFKEELK